MATCRFDPSWKRTPDGSTPMHTGLFLHVFGNGRLPEFFTAGSRKMSSSKSVYKKCSADRQSIWFICSRTAEAYSNT